ncbi:MAG: ribosomal L7Ae/L30e/S12e/Gadd45 family protein [Clostridia bacterium]|nr:ribosomal L7Ae/L30e/S12e/Gadd45 family protein [Clostridia bacterium]
MKYVGIKQVLKAVENNEVKTVYVGDDAEEHVTAKLIKLCKEKNIEIKHIKTMEELGKMAEIEVKSAAAAE